MSRPPATRGAVAQGFRPQGLRRGGRTLKPDPSARDRVLGSVDQVLGSIRVHAPGLGFDVAGSKVRRIALLSASWSRKYQRLRCIPTMITQGSCFALLTRFCTHVHVCAHFLALAHMKICEAWARCNCRLSPRFVTHTALQHRKQFYTLK